MNSHPIHIIDEWAKRNLDPFLSQHKFKERSRASHSAYANIQYSNAFLTIQLDTEYGIMSLSVGSSQPKHDLIHASFIKDFLEPAPNGRWNLSLEGSLDFIETNYDWLKNHFEPNNYKSTAALINEHCAKTFKGNS